MTGAGERCEVAIVGGGAVGLLLACLLAQRGVEVVVLERRAATSASSRAIGIHPPGLAALDAAGVGDAVRREAQAIRVGIALSGGTELGRMTFGEGRIVSLPQHRTEALLRQRLAELAPGALRRGVTVTGLHPGADDVELEVVAGREATGRLVAQWVVGADGVRSTVRALLGIAWLPRPGTAAYAMIDAPDATGARHAALLHLEPGGIVESFPMPAGERRWVARLASPETPERLRPLTSAALQAVLRQRLVDPPALPPHAQPSTFLVRQRIAARFASGRVVLAGDAAHEVSPIGGQGMTLGWLDAVAIDRALASVRRGEPQLERCVRARQRAAERAVRRAAWNMRMGAPARGTAMAARLALARLLARPPGRALLVAAFTMRGL